MLRKKLGVMLVLGALFAGSAMGEETDSRHPMIGNKAPDILLAEDILALPDSEQQAWVHGAVSMMFQTISDVDAAKCVLSWYFDGSSAHENVMFALNRYSDSPATAIVFAVAAVSCPSIKEASD